MLTVTIDTDVAKACQPLIQQRQLSKIVNELLRNLVLNGDTSQEKVIAIAEEARKPLEQKRDQAREELLLNAAGVRWIGDRSIRQQGYWVGRCGFKDWDGLVRWVRAEVFKRREEK